MTFPQQGPELSSVEKLTGFGKNCVPLNRRGFFSATQSRFCVRGLGGRAHRRLYVGGAERCLTSGTLGRRSFITAAVR